MKKISINRTKLIYKYDDKTNKNPHEIIDNSPNLLVLVKLKNKKSLAAFTQMGFNKDQP
jgi:hypothetical protein